MCCTVFTVMKLKRAMFGTIRSYPLVGGVAVLLALSPAAASVELPDFNRYEVILSRRPFGAAPAESSEGLAIVPPAPPPEFAANLKMCAITDSGGKIRVGFIDGGAKPRTYFLFVGDSENGYEVMRADYEAETAVVKKDGQEVEIKMGGGGGRVAAAATAAAVTAPQLASTPAGRRAEIAARRRPVERVLSPGRQLRLEEEQRRAEVIPDLHGAVLEKHLQEYNMQAIRSGAPALPIPLTPEQDARLVEEGILPPAE
jgi:hypothetical protein